MGSIIYLSQQGYDDLKSELKKLKNEERKKVINQIAEARDKGDLSENAEYDAAKEAQGHLETRIAKLEEELANSRVLKNENIDTSNVRLLTKVTIQNLSNDVTMTYSIVSESEADLAAKKISSNSPIGKGLIGGSVGDIVEIKIPNGIVKFKIISIESI
jgi:transcription elongation factor GreA